MPDIYWTKKVKGSKDKEYEVAFESRGGAEFWSCTCPSFKYRPGDCKHIAMVKKG